MATKKLTVKKSVSHRKAAKPKTLALKVVGDPQPMPAPVPEPMPGPCCDSAPSASRVVYFAGCRNCCHVPLGVNAVLTVLIAIIFTLSAMLMVASVAIASQ